MRYIHCYHGECSQEKGVHGHVLGQSQVRNGPGRQRSHGCLVCVVGVCRDLSAMSWVEYSLTPRFNSMVGTSGGMQRPGMPCTPVGLGPAQSWLR